MMSDENLSLSDELLGRHVRETVDEFAMSQRNGVILYSAARVMISVAHSVNSDNTTLDIGGVTVNDMPIGDWRVTVERITPAPVDDTTEPDTTDEDPEGD